MGVLAYDPWKDNIILLEQFRIGAYVNELESSSTSDNSPWLLEIIAGIVEPGESCQEVAHREALEEAGCRLPVAGSGTHRRFFVQPRRYFGNHSVILRLC